MCATLTNIITKRFIYVSSDFQCTPSIEHIATCCICISIALFHKPDYNAIMLHNMHIMISLEFQMSLDYSLSIFGFVVDAFRNSQNIECLLFSYCLRNGIDTEMKSNQFIQCENCIMPTWKIHNLTKKLKCIFVNLNSKIHFVEFSCVLFFRASTKIVCATTSPSSSQCRNGVLAKD